MQFLYNIYALIASVRMHPFWNRSFWRAFGVWGVAIAIACLLTAVIGTTRSLKVSDFGSYLGCFAVLFLPAPLLAWPLCTSIRLYPILFSNQWRQVGDWAITHVLAIILLIVARFVSERVSIYVYVAGAIILCAFPVFAYERIYGKIKPE